MRKPTLLTILAFAGALIGAAPASAATVWNLDLHHHETHFPPGGKAQIWIHANNVGDTASAGKTTVTLELPAGLTRSAIFDTGFVDLDISWACPGSAGDTTIVCETTGSIPRHRLSRRLIVQVEVDPGIAPGTVLTAEATLEGGGAAQAAMAEEPIEIDPTPAPFGILSESFLMDFFEPDGLTLVRQAGSHPPLLTSSFDFTSLDTGLVVGSLGTPIKRESESLRNISVDLPPGFLGDPTAIGECTQALFTLGECPRSSQVGRMDASVYPTQSSSAFNFSTGVFNLTHPRGAVTDLGFVIAGNPVHIRASLDPSRNYAITTTVPNINETLPPFNSKVTIWGVPADPSHDSERCPAFSPAGSQNGGDTSSSCSAEHPREAFLTVPNRCSGANTMRLRDYDSWQDTGDFGPDITYDLPGSFEGCGKPTFEPEITLEPTGSRAGEPTGLDVSVHVPQNEDPDELATPPIERTTVTLPEGMAVNPAFANGLEGCSESQIGLGTNRAIRCPDASRIGQVELSTPLLPTELEGSMYLAEQQDNPFDSLLAFYIAMHDTEERGVLVKVPGHVELDSRSGRITTTFEDLPELPFEDLTLKFRSGDRAPLVNPPTCGTHRIEAEFASHAQPGKGLDRTSVFELERGPRGAHCVSALERRLFEPGLLAGSWNPTAGAFSPLSARVTRNDSDQEISTVDATAPPGLSASLVGVPKCSEAQIAAAMRRDDPGDGAKEQASPSCPAASQVGRVITGAGAGPFPIYVPGKVYLAGPYKGAPLSGVAIVPAVAGPVDLGAVVVRSPAYVNPVTAQVSIQSDPVPQVVNGVLIRVRDVRIHLDRPGFVLNPTNCEPSAIAATLHSAEGKSKALASRFQVGACERLGFKPRLGIRLKGGTKRGGHPALRATYVPRAGHANVRRLALTFPSSAFVENANFKTICTRVQYAAKACPPGSIYGRAKAWTPLLEAPLEGPVYLRSSDNLLPDAVFALNGEVSAEVAVRIDSVKGRLRATVQSAPDVPVSRVVVQMRAGRKGLFVNSRDICRGANRARANMRAQNGRRALLRPRFRAQGCNKKAKRRPGKRGRGRGR